MGRDGVLYVADGPYSYALQPGNPPAQGHLPLPVAGMLFTPGYPGYSRGLAASAGLGEIIVTTGAGAVARYRPAKCESEILAQGFDQLYGVAVAPGGAVVFAELGTGRVLSVCGGKVEELATGLNQPMGVTIGPDGTCLVSESGAGRVIKLHRGRAETVLDGLRRPQGVLLCNGLLYVVDTAAKELVEYNIEGHIRRTIVTDLPVGAPPGVTPKFLRGIGGFCGPMGPFAGITAAADGTLYVSGDAEGSVLALRPSL